MLRSVLIKASDSAVLREQVMRRRFSRAIAERFVAGERLEQGLDVVRQLSAQGKTASLDYLGESVTSEAEAIAAADVYVEALGRIADEGLACGISVKPTQMGLHVSTDLCRDLLRRIAKAAADVPPQPGEPAGGAHVTIDMEGSDVTEVTVAMTEELVAEHPNVGCAVQSYLRRTTADVARLSEAGASLRLCKGAYAEPDHLAYQARVDVDTSYAALARRLLRDGIYPRLATHDDRLIERAKYDALRLGIDRDRFEFQMLYGVRTPLQDALVAEGYRLRVYVPFGDQWYPYFMRRLAERPANLIFFLRALVPGS